MEGFLVGIDFGTTGAKCCIIDDQGDVLAYAYREYPIISNKPDWAEHNPDLYWEVACQIIQECIYKSKVDVNRIRGIGTSSALPSLVMVDKSLNTINNAYTLLDNRVKEEIVYVKSLIGEQKLFEITGNRLEDRPIVVSMLWEKKNRYEDFSRIYKVLTVDGFIRLRLTGIPSANCSSGVYFGVAYDIRKHELNKDILKQIGLSHDIFPDFSNCDKIIGCTSKTAALQTSLPEGIAVVAGQVDCNAGWLGGGAIEAGDMSINLGTCGNFGIIHKSTDFINSMINVPYTTDTDSTYVTIASTNTGGQALRYIRDNFSESEVVVEKITGLSTYHLMDLQAQRVAPGSEGLIVLPYFTGERTPIWDLNAKGVIFGLGLNHTKSHIIRAMMEAVGYALYSSLEILIKEGICINKPVIMNEGGARSLVWRKILTDILDIPSVLLENRIGAPYGDAILAGVSAGVFKDYRIARDKAHYIDYLEPDRENNKLYMEYYAIYKDLYKHLKEDFSNLSRIEKTRLTER